MKYLVIPLFAISALMAGCDKSKSAIEQVKSITEDKYPVANMPDEPLDKPLEIVREPKRLAIGEWSAGVKDDGTLWTWGTGSLLDGRTQSLSPVKVEGVNDAVAVSGGISGHMLLLRKDGTVWGWGSNSYGQIDPDDKNTSIKTLSQIKGIKNIIDISAGIGDSIFLTQDGKVYGIGENSDGWMNGDNHPVKKPIKLENLNNIIRIEFLNGILLALNSNGELFSTGSSERDLGRQINKTNPNIDFYPAQKIEFPLKVADFSVTSTSAKVLLSDGSVWVWGSNGDDAELGLDTTKDISIPTKNPNLHKIININNYSAVDNQGNLYTWGKFGFGNSKSASVTTYYKPIRIMQNVKPLQLHYGLRASAVVNQDGSVYMWDWNDLGQRGNGKIVTDNMDKAFVFTPEKSLFTLN